MPSGNPFPWPGGARAAICLTYDDGMATHLDRAAPALEAHGLRGTFFVSDREGALTARHADWSALGLRGHEVAGHTVAHPCGREHFWVQPGEALEDYDEARMLAQFSASDALIQDLGAPKPQTFAYTCGQSFIGEDKRSYRALVRAHYRAARGMQERLCEPWTEDLQHTAALDGQGLSAEALIAKAAAAAETGAWAVYMFHGVGGEHLAVSAEAHARFLKHLSSDAASYWVATFAQATAWVAEHR